MPTYQWYQNSSLLSGATSATLTFSPLDPTNAGSYYVIVQNTTNSVLNSVQSSTVSVGVLADNPITNVISPTLSQVASFRPPAPMPPQALTRAAPICACWILASRPSQRRSMESILPRLISP